MTLIEKIAENRRRQARYDRAQRVLRAVRIRIFDYEDQGKLAKAQRVIQRCKKILMPLWDAERRNAQARKLEKTPSAFEPGLCG